VCIFLFIDVLAVFLQPRIITPHTPVSALDQQLRGYLEALGHYEEKGKRDIRAC